jgi:hypothetical protein
LGKKIGQGAVRAGKWAGGKTKSAVKWLGRKLFGGPSIMDTVRKQIEEAKQLENATEGVRPHDPGTPATGGGGKEPPTSNPKDDGGGGGGSGGTGTVWDQINPTGPMRSNTQIPQFFELQTSGGKFFVNTNATKHMEELVVGAPLKDKGKVSHSIAMRSQTVLTSFADAMDAAVKQGIRYGEIMNVGPWELIIEKTGKSGPLPVVKHAVYR